MSQSMRNSCVVLALAVLIAGCSKAEDKLVKQQIELINSMAAEFEKVTDLDSMGKIQPEVAAISLKLQKINEDLKAMPPEAREAGLTAHKAELDQANERLKAAKGNLKKVLAPAK